MIWSNPKQEQVPLVPALLCRISDTQTVHCSEGRRICHLTWMWARSPLLSQSWVQSPGKCGQQTWEDSYSFSGTCRSFRVPLSQQVNPVLHVTYCLIRKAVSRSHNKLRVMVAVINRSSARNFVQFSDIKALL